MQSLYNIAGFLGAQSRSNPSDHGDSWSIHKAAKLQSPSQDDTNSLAFLETVAEQPKLQPQNATSRQECIAALDLLTQLNRKYVEITCEPELIPIKFSTINVGDIVRFVERPTDGSDWHRDLTVDKHYKVIDVDRSDTRYTIRVKDDAGDRVWVVNKYFMQVV